MAFLGLAIHAGASCAITDPTKYTAYLKGCDLLMGRDAYAAKYIKYFRTHPIEKKE
jgi:hypothetical protein